MNIIDTGRVIEKLINNAKWALEVLKNFLVEEMEKITKSGIE
jgi:hypothetical protein